MNKKIGFIGFGKMAQAISKGILKSESILPENIMASAKTEETLQKMNRDYTILSSRDNREVAAFSDLLILAVKPDLHPAIIREIKDEVKENTIIVTIAAGISLNDLKSLFERNIKAVRTMPNTPSFIGEGMTVLCPNEWVSDEDLKSVQALFECVGETEVLEEKLMDAVPAISGSSPAYVYMMIEAMADGGVRLGIPRDKAYRLASQAVLGAAKMVLESSTHPGELKDNVCTPGGATIEAVASLEKNHFRGTVLDAMDSCFQKTKALGN
ncbi:pyrroline-5-carboxylate reductase [Neobacillus terrae]|uniref:pyrroline-5-carboxylate reductase n=1 Tax=Neobacillus terrae TaxID=3034837 RepID=UPI00140E38BA|nr:pyrroline-5-carboxylate reductase [Neobacillus terrae]NHM31850.1 pyrroline-5-carboxylate reductase [Neobacillus terrae]